MYTGENLIVGANLTVLGNLIVQGEVATLNTTSLAVEDLNITVAKDAASAAQADGAGITVGGAGATFNYVASTDAWTSNKNIYASAFYTGGDIKWSGNSAVYRSGINYTPSDSAPINSNYGDQWYDTTTDILYEWQTADGVNGFWIDIGSLAIVANANLSSTTFTSITTGNISAGNASITSNLVVGQSGVFRGPYNETDTRSGVFLGNTGTGGGITPRVGFFNGNTQQNWQIDNNVGELRFFVPGSTKMSLFSNGNLNVTGGLTVGGKRAVNGPAFRAFIATGQTIPTGGAQTKVTFGSETYDTDNCFTGSAFTPTVEGYYQLNATIRMQGPSGTNEVMFVLWKNGTEYARGTNSSGTELGTNFYALQVSTVVYANGTTDYFEIAIQHGHTVDRDTTSGTNISHFSGAMVRGA